MNGSETEIHAAPTITPGFASPKDSLVTLNRIGEIIGWSAAASALTGRSALDVIGRVFPEGFLSPPDVSRWRADFASLSCQFTPHFAGYHWRTGDGRYEMLTCWTSVVRHSHGALIGFIVSSIADRGSVPENRQPDPPTARELIEERLQERRIVSRFLHDTLSQDLVVLSFALAKLAPGAAASLSGDLQTALALIDRCCGSVRLLSYLLQPPLPPNENLAEAVSSHLDFLHAEAGLEVPLQITGDVDKISSTAACVVFDAIHEWTSRAVFKTDTPHLALGLIRNESGILLELNTTKDHTVRLPEDGWTTLRHRVREQGGTFEFRDGPSSVTLSLSLPQPASRVSAA